MSGCWFFSKITRSWMKKTPHETNENSNIPQTNKSEGLYLYVFMFFNSQKKQLLNRSLKMLGQKRKCSPRINFSYLPFQMFSNIF